MLTQTPNYRTVIEKDQQTIEEYQDNPQLDIIVENDKPLSEYIKKVDFNKNRFNN